MKNSKAKISEVREFYNNGYLDGYDDAIEQTEQIKSWIKYEQQPPLNWTLIILALAIVAVVMCFITNLPPTIN
jgi:hypothetical protein